MPSVTHEAPIELIRQHPGLAVELLQAMSDVDLPSDIAVSLGPTDLSEVVPVKFLADAVVIVADKATGEPALVIIIEPQGRDDSTKEFSWPVYVTVTRRHLQCQRAFLLVICPDPAEAEKWTHATPEEMAWESYKIAVTRVYPAIPFQDFCGNQD